MKLLGPAFGPPPGPFRPQFWRSPLRGPWLTAALGTLLLGVLTVIIVTGFASHAAYEPDLGANGIVDPSRDLPLTPGWPTSPTWLYALNQGLHVTVGIITIPLLLAKLWSVIPRLFVWPPVSTPAQAIERAVVALLVASAGFEFATGVANIQSWYVFRFNFLQAHYYGAVVFVAALAAHLVIKVPVALRAFRTRGVLAPLRADLAGTRPEPSDPHGGLAPVAPNAPTVSRRGLFGLVGAGSFALLVATAGQSIGGPLRGLAFLAPRRENANSGPNGFQVNKTFASTGIKPEQVGEAYRLTLRGGPEEVSLSREELLAMPQVTESLPIACVEGWSTTQEWTGVRLAELARRAGVTAGGQVEAVSLQPSGVLRRATLNAGQLADERSLLALRVNGADLSPDHGFPARIIVPALPGVHNTKWVGALNFQPVTA